MHKKTEMTKTNNNTVRVFVLWLRREMIKHIQAPGHMDIKGTRNQCDSLAMHVMHLSTYCTIR